MAGFPSGGGLASTNLPFFPIENVPGYTTADIGPSVATAIAQAQGFGEVIFPAATRQNPLNWLTTVTAPAGPNLRFRGMGQDITNILCGTFGQCNAGGIGGFTGWPLASLCPGGLWDMTIDAGAMGTIGTLGTGLTNGTPITSLTLASNMVATQVSVFTKISYTSGNPNITTNNLSPGVINGMICTSNQPGIAAGTTVTGAGTNTLTLSPAPSANSTGQGATLTFTTAGTGLSSLAGGVLTVTNPSGLHSQDFVLTGPISGAAVTNLPIFWDMPNFSFPVGSTVTAPLCQGSGMCFLYANPSGGAFGTGDGTQPNQYHLRNLVLKNLNATQLTPSDQQYTALILDVGSSYSPERYLVENVQVGPNTNANQDAFSLNTSRYTIIRNLQVRQHYRTANLFTSKDADLSGIQIENPIPGANASGNNVNRMLVLGESNCDADIRVRGLKMLDRYGIGGNVVVGCRGFYGTGVKMPGCENIVTSATANVTIGGGAGGTFTLIQLAQAPVVPLSVMATANTPVKFAEFDNQATGAGDWTPINQAPGMTVQQAITATSFTVNFNSSAMTGLNVNPVLNNHNSPGPSNLSWARFMMGTSDIQFNFSNDKTGTDTIICIGDMGSGVTLQNGIGSNGPQYTKIIGKLGAFYNGVGSNGCMINNVTASGAGILGPIHLDCLYYPSGGPIITNANTSDPLNLVAVGTAFGLGNPPKLISQGAIVTPEAINIENLLPVYGFATLVAGTVTVANTLITTNSIIQLYPQVLGGTPGALFISAKAASTSFTISSTNAGDTSTVRYKIIQY